MLFRIRRGSVVHAAAIAAAMLMAVADARAFDESKYPDLKGQWDRTAQPRWADAKSAPLTPEYRAIFEENLKDQAAGGQGTDPTFTCVAPGMPRVMNMYAPFEIVVTPRTTHMLMDHIHDSRRIFTDGREWPKEMQPNFNGYSIGTWIDEDGDGRYDVLVVETRGLAGPRSYDSTGLPFHADNETVINERIYLDKANPNLLHDDITTTDHALTRPWVVNKTFRRMVSDKPIWFGHQVCGEGNVHVGIGKEVYFLSGDGLLMPAVKDQPPPDLRYFRKYDR